MSEVWNYAEFWTKPQAAGGTRSGFFLPIAPQRRRRLNGDDALSFALYKTHRLATTIAKGMAVREVLSADGATWREWVVDRVNFRSGDSLTMQIDCLGMLAQLVNYPVTTSDADGYVYSTTSAIQLAPSTIISGYIRSNAPSWITSGTVTPTALAEVPFAGDSALSGGRRLEEAVPGYELWLEANSTTDYKVNFSVLGGSAPTLYLRAAKNLKSLEKSILPGQVTRVNQVNGAAGDDGPSGLAWAYWEVVSTAGSGPYTVVLKAIHGGDGPIAFDNQFNHSGLPGGSNSLYLEKRDGTFTNITGSSASAQSLTVASITTITAGDWVRIVASSSGLHLTSLDSPTELAANGVLAGKYESPWDDALCVVKNALQEVWPSTLPTGWTGLGAKSTTANEFLTSGAALLINQSVSDGAQIAAPPARSWYIRKRKTTYSAVAWIRLRAVLGAGSVTMQVKVNGTVVGSGLVYTSPAAVWRQLKIEGLDLSAYVSTTVTLTLEIVKSGGAGTVNMLVDSMCLFPSLAAKAVTTGSNAARIWQGVNDFLDENRAIRASYTVNAADLDRMGRANQVGVSLGGSAVVVDDEIGTVTARVVDISDRPDDPGDATYVLSNIPSRLSRQPSKPLPLVIPFFEPIEVRVADRDTRNAQLKVKASITASDETSVTVTVDAADTLGGTPAISYAVFGATYVSGSGSGPYVFTKPAVGTGLGRAVFTATQDARTDVYDAIDIPESDPPVLLAITATQTAADDTTVTVDVTAVDPRGTATISIADDGGAATTGPTGDSWVIARPTAGDPPLLVKFTASATNRTSQSCSVTVTPQDDGGGGGTFPPSIDAFYENGINTSTEEVTLEWTVSNPPASPTYDLKYWYTITDAAGVVQEAATSTLSSISTPYALGLAALNFDIKTKNPGTTGFDILTLQLRMKDGSTVVATKDISVTVDGDYNP